MTDRDQLREKGAEAVYVAAAGELDLGWDNAGPMARDLCFRVADAVLAVLPQYEQVGEACLSCGWVGRPDDCGCGLDMRHVPVYIVREDTDE